MRRFLPTRIALILSSVFLVAWSPINLGGGTPVSASGTNFTEDANAVGCWLMATDTTQSSFEANRCGALNMAYFGSTFAVGSGSPKVPVGSVTNSESASFDGTNDYFGISDNTVFEKANITVGCWGYHEAAQNDIIFGKNDVQNFELAYRSDDTLRGEIKDVEQYADTTGTGLGTWLHFSMRYDGTDTSLDAANDEVEVFYMGKLDCASCASSADPAANGNSLRIGVDWNAGQDFTGDIFECYYFDRVLSDAEMAELFLCGIAGNADGAARDAAYTGAQCSDIDTCC